MDVQEVKKLDAYLKKLFGNARIARYLSQNHADIYRELQVVSEGSSLEN